MADTYDPLNDALPVWAQPDAAYTAALEQAAPGITAMIPQQQAPGESWMDTLARSLPIIATTWQQKQILDIQVDRAKKGLPPLDASQYSAGINVGLSPDVQKMLMWGGIGLAVVLLVTARR